MVTTNVSSRRSIEEITGSGAAPPPRQSASQFSKGSIVSLRMKNFLVYKDVIATFGPRLNVVVGPNGSGKSTLVCAIALGLGGSPKVLGRADYLSSFVMHGVNEDASITVELFIPQGQNIEIKRTFSRKNNSSIWHVNGRSQTDKEVKAKVNLLGIQVDNLCTMLPQDKVGDFSGFSPDKLLLETQKALSFNDLYTPHLKLMDLQDSSVKNVAEEDTTEKKLDTMQTELHRLEGDVQRFEERQEKEAKRLLHEQRKLWVRTEELSAEGRTMNQDYKQAVLELASAKEADRPLQLKVNSLLREAERLKGAVNTRTRKRDDHDKAAKVADTKIEKMVGEAKTQKSEIKNIATRRKNKQEQLQRSINDLKSLEEKLADAREQSAASPCAKGLCARITAKQDESLSMKTDLAGQEKIYENAQYGIRDTDGTIKKLTNLKAVREKNFRQHFRDSAEVALKVRDWAAHNADKLRGPVSGPVGLEVTVEDPEAAIAVETQVARHLWCSMVVNYKEDHDTIIQAFRNERRSISVLVNQGGMLKPQQSMFSPAEMEELGRTAGVRGFLDNFISCPDTIRQTLRRNAKIDRTFLGSAITQNKISSDPTFLPSLGKPVRGIPTNSVIYAGGAHGLTPGRAAETLQQYATKISLYGQRKPSVRVSETRSAQVVGGGVDAVAVEAQEQEKAGHEQLLRAAAHKRKIISTKIKTLKDEEENIRNEYSNVQSLRSTENRFEGAVQRMEKIVRGLKEELNEDGEAEKVSKINRLEQVLIQHVQHVQTAQEHFNGMLDMSVEIIAATLALRTAKDKHMDASETLKQAHQTTVELENRAKKLMSRKEKIKVEFQEEHRKAKMKAPKVVEGTEEPTEFGEQYHDLPSSRAELDAVIEDINGDLAQTVANPQVIEKYEKLKKEVAAAAQALSELKDRNTNSAGMINAISTPWAELLQNMVDKLDELFREYMSKMDGCVGEIVLAKDESYKRWGVEIRVRFRSDKDGGKLAVLNKLVHSGGERSVSTILYLMALQDLQQSPFRVVDEINQGMDPKNERGVFSRIVLNSCGPNRKQYFLITPKLLQGLVAMDNDDVTIIVIMNGKDIMNGTSEHSMRNFINAKKRQLAMQAGMVGRGPPKQPRTVR